MTCIIALKQDGKIYMGGDSCATNGWYYTVLADKKVFKLRDLLIGVSGSFREAQIIRYLTDIPARTTKDDDMRYLVAGVLEHFRDRLEHHGVDKMDGRLLIGYRGKIYEIQDNFQALVSVKPYAVIGGGADFAYGALAAQTDEVRPEERIFNALQISGQFNIGVCEPYYVLEM